MRLTACLATAATAVLLTSCASDAPVTVNSSTNSSTSSSTTSSATSSTSTESPSSSTSSSTSSSSSPQSSSPSESPTSSASSSAGGGLPAGAEADSKNEFHVTKPAGWAKATVPNAQIVLAIKADKPTGGVFSNFNVVSTPGAPGQNLDAYVNAGATQMRQQNATVTPVADRKIAGGDAKGYVVKRSVSGKDMSQTQYFTQKGNTVYISTMTNATSEKAAGDSAMNAILGSWTWTS